MPMMNGRPGHPWAQSSSLLRQHHLNTKSNQGRTGYSNWPWLIRQTGPMTSGVTRNSTRGPLQITYPRRALPP